MGKDLKGNDIGKGFSQRPDGRYEARAVVNGKKIDIYNLSLPVLKKEFEVAKAMIITGEAGVTPKLTLNDWFEEWFTKCKSPQLKSDVGRKSYERKIRNTFIRILGKKRLSDISQMNIQEAANQLIEEKYQQRGIKEALSMLRECMDVAVANKAITTNPVRGVVIRDGNEMARERRVLDHWEQDLFLEEIEGSYYKEAYLVLLLTGMRIGEFSALRWEDIDFGKKRIHISRSMLTAYMNGEKIMEITTPKTANSYRDIPFFGNIGELLMVWKKKQDLYKKKLGQRWRTDKSFGDLAFTTTLGSPITRYNIVHDLKKVENNIQLKENGRAIMEGRVPREFKHLHPHAFRHTFATRCFEKGLDPLLVQNIMGHSNYSTTISYTHVLDMKKNEAIAMAGSLLD